MNGVGVPVEKELKFAQAVQDSPAKEPVPNPILAAPMNVTELAVKLSVPFNDSKEPAAIGTADAVPARLRMAALARSSDFIGTDST